VTTLGRALARRLGAAHFDTDDFYWLPSEPPYRCKRDVGDRVHLLNCVLRGAPAWVLSGSVGSWADPLVRLFDLVVFVDTPTGIRLERLRCRETERFGELALAPGGGMHTSHEAFLAWAAAYDTGTWEGRSRPKHEAWLARLPCPTLRVDGAQPTGTLVDAVLGTGSDRPQEQHRPGHPPPHAVGSA
jgi:adenylate kinase family enzyme